MNSYRQFGGSGVIVADDTTNRVAKVYAIVALTDTVIATVTAQQGQTVEGVNGMTLPAGLTLFARLEEVQLTSGSALLYLE